MSVLGASVPVSDPDNLHPSVHSECIFGSFITVLTKMIILILLVLRERGRAMCVAVLDPGQKKIFLNVSIIVRLI